MWTRLIVAMTVMGWVAVTASTASAQSTRETLIGLRLVDQHISAESYYNGSSFSGGGIMSAIATYRAVERDAKGRIIRQTTIERNETFHPNITWSSSDPSIYDLEYGNFVQSNGYLPDGLYIYGGDSSAVGTTIVTVKLKRFTATGSITFWAD